MGKFNWKTDRDSYAGAGARFCGHERPAPGKPHPTAGGRANAPVQRRAAQQAVRCNRWLERQAICPACCEVV